MCLIRSSNSVPLLDFDDDSCSCAIFAAFRRISWSRFGIKLEISTDPLAYDKQMLNFSFLYDSGVYNNTQLINLKLHVNLISASGQDSITCLILKMIFLSSCFSTIFKHAQNCTCARRRNNQMCQPWSLNANTFKYMRN